MSTAIVITSGKGGTGKTSLTGGVASCLAALGHRVLCIDMDIGLRNLDISLGLSDRALMDFSDVDPAASYGEAVRWAASEGIAGGYGGGLFGPDDPITREQLAVMLYRYARHEGYDTAQGGMAVREFADYDQIAGYAAEAMTWAVEAGVLTATSLDTLAPGQAATRVQTAQALLALSQFTK